MSADTAYSAGRLVAHDEVSMPSSGDTTCTDNLWLLAGEAPDLAAAFVVTSFPDRLEPLEQETGLLTPAMLIRELEKLDKPEVPVKIFHMKPQYLDEISSDLQPLKQRCQMLQGNECFTFKTGSCPRL
jgi:hypothetical protein